MNEFLRIDDRLIHGQVLLSWVPALEIGLILVADDEVAGNPVQKEFLQTTTTTVDIRVLPVCDAAQAAAEHEDGRGVLVLFRNPGAVLKYVQTGRLPKKINVGCLKYEEGRSQISKSVAASPQDIKIFKKLQGMDIALEIRMVPPDKSLVLLKVIQNREYQNRKGKKS